MTNKTPTCKNDHEQGILHGQPAKRAATTPPKKKCMNNLIKENGSTTNIQSELLQETMNFYKKLYTKTDRREVNLNLLLNEFNIPKEKEPTKLN